MRGVEWVRILVMGGLLVGCGEHRDFAEGSGGGGASGAGGGGGGASGAGASGATTAGGTDNKSGASGTGGSVSEPVSGEAGAGGATDDPDGVDEPECGAAPDRTCSVECPCLEGEGVCTADDQCVDSATCVSNGGQKFGRSGGTCLAAHCDNDKKDAGETSVDCGSGCGCLATFEIVSYSSVPTGAKLSGLTGMTGDGSRFAAVLDRNRVAYPALVNSLGAVTELEHYGKGGSTAAISADGAVVVGAMGCANPPQCTDTTWTQARWSGSSAGPVALATSGTVKALSGSGTFIVGNAFDSTADANRGILINGNQLTTIQAISFASGVTRDGKYVAGELTSGGVGLWLSTNGAVTKIGAAKWDFTRISAVSGTEPVVVGTGEITATSDRIGYRWKGGVITELGELAEGRVSNPSAVSVDGTTVVGAAGDFPQSEAFIWTDAGKLRSIVDELEARGYEPPSDLQLTRPQFISDDGKTIVGVEIADPPTFWRVVLD